MSDWTLELCSVQHSVCGHLPGPNQALFITLSFPEMTIFCILDPWSAVLEQNDLFLLRIESNVDFGVNLFCKTFLKDAGPKQV